MKSEDLIVAALTQDSFVQPLAKMSPSMASDFELVSQDPLMENIVCRARRIAASDATVLISGETGTGKEVIARYIHRNSSRSKGRFVAVNCAAIPDGLLETELFGHERGAFSGALQRRYGKIEVASGGTLLLDEISELDIRLQAKLLRALQEREIDRVGGSWPIPTNTRIIATTNKDLRAEVRSQTFRADLFFRVAIATIHIPNLRDRPKDILALSHHFLEKYKTRGAGRKPTLDESACRLLLNHQWRGNVRELENAIQRAIIVTNGDLLSETAFDLTYLSFNHEECEGQRNIGLSQAGEYFLCVVEKETVAAALRKVNGNRTRAAVLLGISTKTLRRKLRHKTGSSLSNCEGTPKCGSE